MPSCNIGKLKKKHSDLPIMTSSDDMTSPLTSEGMTSSQYSGEGGRFGIRNYLHYFYEDCIGLERRESLNNNKGLKEGCRYERCKVRCMMVGVFYLIIILIGFGLLVYGYCQQGGLLAITSADFHDRGSRRHLSFESIEIIGASLFCFGGIGIVLCFLWISLGHLKEQKELIEHEEFQRRLMHCGIAVKRGSLQETLRSSVKGYQPPDTASLRKVTTVQPSTKTSHAER